MRIFITIILVCLTLGSSAQKQGEIIGVWNVVGFGAGELFFDTKGQSITKSGDSELDSAMLAVLQEDLLKHAPSGKFVFKENGQFIQETNGKPDGEGIYKTDFKRATVTLIGRRNGIKITEIFKYKMDGRILFLTEVDSEEKFTYKLERAL